MVNYETKCMFRFDNNYKKFQLKQLKVFLALIHILKIESLKPHSIFLQIVLSALCQSTQETYCLRAVFISY